MMVMLSFLLPGSLEVSAGNEQVMLASNHTFDRICLDKLSAINEKWFWDRVPGHSVGHTDVDVCR